MAVIIIPPIAMLGSQFPMKPSVFLPRGSARPSHGVEIERVTDGEISLTGETEDCQYRAVESPGRNISLNG